MAYQRKTCAVCGQENVPHTKRGDPIWSHTRTDRHFLGVIAMRKAARAAAEQALAAEPVTAWCPHEPCGEAFRESQIKDGGTPYHDFPKPCRSVCPGAKRLPLRVQPPAP
jgi:hypothetical protein